MIVEDHVLTRTRLEQGVHWGKLNIQVCSLCNGGIQAISVLQHTHVDILLTAICIEDMDGLKLAHIVKQNYPHICIVFMSTYREFEYVVQALRLGARDYLLKPVDMDELVKAMKGVVKYLEGDDCKKPEEELGQNYLVRCAKEYIHKNIVSGKVNLKETAEALHVNYYYLSKCFKRHEQCTFTSYVNNIRMRIICELLNNTTLNVSEICQKIGMDQKYFYELFNRKKGLSPLKYRAQKKAATNKPQEC